MLKNKVKNRNDKVEKYFFDIPVFRCSLHKFSKERGQAIEKMAKKIAGSENEVTEKDREFAESGLPFSSFRYSEMIGMVRLYAMNQQIRGEYYFLKNKRITRNLKDKRWSYFGKLFEFEVFPHYSNEDIFNRIMDYLTQEQQSGRFKGRYLETEPFENAGSVLGFKVLTNTPSL